MLLAVAFGWPPTVMDDMTATDMKRWVIASRVRLKLVAGAGLK